MSSTISSRRGERSLRHVIVSQLGPTFLLTLTVWFLLIGLDEAAVAVKLAAADPARVGGSGAVAAVSAANEGLAVVHDELRGASCPRATALGRRGRDIRPLDAGRSG